MSDQSDFQSEYDAGLLLEDRPEDEIQPPLMYRVIMLNDDYTTMEFVVDVLRRIFRKSEADSHRLMLLIHNTGQATAGVYTREIAQTKVAEVHQSAESQGFPLKCIIEPD